MSIVSRIKAAVVRFVDQPVVLSVARHAIIAAFGVLVVSGGNITAAVIVAAVAAALRVVWLAVVAALSANQG